MTTPIAFNEYGEQELADFLLRVTKPEYPATRRQVIAYFNGITNFSDNPECLAIIEVDKLVTISGNPETFIVTAEMCTFEEPPEYQLTYESRSRPVTISIMAATETECWVQLQNILDKEVKADSADIVVIKWLDSVNQEFVRRLTRVDAYGEGVANG